MNLCIEVPFINGKFINGYLSLNKLISNNIEYDHGKLIIFLFSLESIELIKQFQPFILLLPEGFVDNNPLVLRNYDNIRQLKDNQYSSITFKEESFNICINETIWNSFACIHYIHIQKNSCHNISCLTLSNLLELRFFYCESYTFINTKTLTISSNNNSRLIINRSTKSSFNLFR